MGTYISMLIMCVHLRCRSSTEVAGLGVGNGVLRFAKQRLQGFVTVPLPETRAYLGFGASHVLSATTSCAGEG